MALSVLKVLNIRMNPKTFSEELGTHLAGVIRELIEEEKAEEVRAKASRQTVGRDSECADRIISNLLSVSNCLSTG